jgi:hypothetical protein
MRSGVTSKTQYPIQRVFWGHFIAVLLFAVSGLSIAAAPAGTAFTYQGNLAAGGQPANGLYDFQFSLLDAATQGNGVADPLSTNSVEVGGGLFTVSLDFGAGAFDGQARWLQIAVRTNGGGDFTTLAPLQPLTASPFALCALNVDLSGPIIATNPANQFQGVFAGDGAGLTNIPAASIVGEVGQGNIGLQQITNLSSLNIAGAQVTSAVPAATYAAIAGATPAAGNPWAPLQTPYRPNCWCSFNDWRGDLPFSTGNYNQSYITNLAAVWLTNGMYAAGFKTIWLDDGWQAATRDGGGNLTWNPLTLTNGGIPALTATLHRMGYQVVLYTSYGPATSTTCNFFPGTTDATMQQDLNRFASWNVDGLMFDACLGSDASGSLGMGGDPTYSYTRHEFASISNALANVSPAHSFWVHLTIAVWPPPPETPFYCNSCGAWGAPGAGGYPDTLDHIVQDLVFIQPYARFWDSPNFMMFGEAMGEGAYYFDAATARFQMTMCALAGSMMRTSGGLDAAGLALYYTNLEVTPLISDPYAKCGQEVSNTNLAQIFVRPLGFEGSGTNLVGLYNAASTNQSITVTWGMLGADAGQPLSFRDLWAGTNFPHPISASLTVSVAPTNIMLLKCWPAFGPTAPWGLRQWPR